MTNLFDFMFNFGLASNFCFVGVYQSAEIKSTLAADFGFTYLWNKTWEQDPPTPNQEYFLVVWKGQL